MSPISNLALELRREHGGSAVEWQQAVDACGSPERARWLLEHAWPVTVRQAWTPGVLILAATTARLLDPDAAFAAT